MSCCVLMYVAHMQPNTIEYPKAQKCATIVALKAGRGISLYIKDGLYGYAPQYLLVDDSQFLHFCLLSMLSFSRSLARSLALSLSLSLSLSLDATLTFTIPKLLNPISPILQTPRQVNSQVLLVPRPP